MPRKTTENPWTVKELSVAEKKGILGSWVKLGVDPSGMAALSREFAHPGMKWHSVTHGSDLVAVFEIRLVPANYFKNMKVFFAPDIEINFEGMSYEEAKLGVDLLAGALGTIFEYLLSALTNGKNSFKIYNDHPYVHMIFYAFAEYLGKKHPDKYKVAFYGKWIELHAVAC